MTNYIKETSLPNKLEKSVEEFKECANTKLVEKTKKQLATKLLEELNISLNNLHNESEIKEVMKKGRLTREEAICVLSLTDEFARLRKRGNNLPDSISRFCIILKTNSKDNIPVFIEKEVKVIESRENQIKESRKILSDTTLHTKPFNSIFSTLFSNFISLKQENESKKENCEVENEEIPEIEDEIPEIASDNEENEEIPDISSSPPSVNSRNSSFGGFPFFSSLFNPQRIAVEDN